MTVPGWLPNAISVARVAMVPLWLWLAERTATDAELRPWLAILLVVLGFSDVVDGWIARRFELDSRTGATVDAIADKLAQVSFVTYLAWFSHPPLHPIALWFWGLLVGRDVVLSIGYFVLRARHGKVDTEHRIHGKIASILLFFVVLSAVTNVDPRMTTVTIWLTAPLIVVSTVDYLWRGFRSLKRSEEKDGTSSAREPEPPQRSRP